MSNCKYHSRLWLHNSHADCLDEHCNQYNITEYSTGQYSTGQHSEFHTTDKKSAGKREKYLLNTGNNDTTNQYQSVAESPEQASTKKNKPEHYTITDDEL